jgi:RHS repeat-associated protein
MTDLIVPTDSMNGVTPGAIDGGVFGVTPDGASSYELPLWVPMGRRGIQPDLRLRYHSRGGNGLLGVGWSLTGLPQITRSPRTIADDKAEGPVLFDKNDPFVLDGERLILVSGTHGVDGAEYGTKRDSFTKIILHDVDSAPEGHILGPTWFEAFHKDGRISSFGGIGAGDLGSRFEGNAQYFRPVPVPAKTPDKQAQASVLSTVLMVRYGWGLKSIRDRSGNTLLVYYDGYPSQPGAPPPARDFLPVRIEYTGSPVDGTPALRTVDFVWQDRPDKEARMMSGLRIPRNKRLKELRMSGPDPTSADPSNTGLLRRYSFGYQNNSVSGRSLLTKITESDRLGVAKGAHTFGWELGLSSFRDIDTGITDIKATAAGRSPLPGRVRVADFDGDGRDDILYVPLSDPDHFYVLRSDPSSPTGFSAPYNTNIPVPSDPVNGRVFVYPDPAGDMMNILVLDDSAMPGTTGSPTYRVYHAGIDRSGASGAIGSFWVFPGRPIFNPMGAVAGPVELADVDGDGLPDLVHGYTGGGGPDPVWYLRANLGGNLNFDSERLIGVYPVEHIYANIDGGSAAAMLVNDAPAMGSDPRYSIVRLQRNNTTVTTTVTLSTLLRDQNHVFGDFTGSGLPSAFSLGNAALSDPTLAENLGGSFGQPIPFVLNLPQPPSAFVPALRVFDWNQDDCAELLVRTRTAAQLTDPMFALRWNGSGFSQIPLPFTSAWDMRFPDQFELFEVFDYDGNGLDDIVMFSGGHLHVFVREGNKADMMTAITDGLGARTSIKYAPISAPTVHTPLYGFVFPQRATASRVWVVSEHTQDNGVGGVNTYSFRYRGGIKDVTGLGFVGFRERTSVHVESGISTTTTYMPEFVGWNGIYPLLGLPTVEVTTTPLGSGVQQTTTTHTTYAVRPAPPGTVPYFVFPLTTVEETVETSGGVPIMPVRRRTVTQDMDAYGNLTTYSEAWSDGNKFSSTSMYSTDPTTWLIGLRTFVTEQSTTPNGLTQTRKRAYEYDAQGLLTREIVEPGEKTPSGYLPLGPQPDGVQTLYRSIDRYPNGNVYRVVEEETTTSSGLKRSVTYVYDDPEHLLPVDISDDLSHHVRATYHPGLAVPISSTDPNGVRTFWQYDGFGQFRQQTSPDGNDLAAHYTSVGGNLRLTVASAAGEQRTLDYDRLGRVVRRRDLARDDGTWVLRDLQYDAYGRIAAVSLPYFEGGTPQLSTFAYDSLARLLSGVGIDGTSLTNAYRGDWVIETDGNKNATARRVDNLGRVVFATDRDAALVGQTPGAQGMVLDYAPFDTLGTITDILGNKTVRTFDRLGRLIDDLDPDRGHRTYQYNALGDLISATKGAGQALNYQYDPVGRLTWIQDPVDGDVKYTWDIATNGVGKLATIDAPASGVTTTFGYDTIGRPTTKNWMIGADTYSMTSSFDPVGRVAGITYPKVGTFKPFTIRYEYGNFGQLLRAADAATGKVYWRWASSDASGRFGREALGNGLLDARLEDPARPSVLKSIQTMDSERILIRNTVYGFDANLNVLTREDKILNTKEKFAYGALDRLRRWTWKGAAGTRRIRWDYDDIGNLRLRKVEAGPGADLSYWYNPAVAGPHAVVSTTLGAYQYDAKGNQIAAPGRIVTYGRHDLPTRVTATGVGGMAIDITYDGEMSRVRAVDQRSGFTTTTIDRAYEYRRANGKAAPDGEHMFMIRVPGRSVARRVWTFSGKRRKSDEIQYVHTDHQRSVEVVTSTTGVADRLKYEPFGRRVSITDPARRPASLKTDLEQGYTSHEHLEVWKLIDMKGRVYDPELGKFLSADPFVPDPILPQAWNRYAYVLNNPVTLRDPTGFADDDENGGSSGNDSVTVSGSTTSIAFGTGSTVIGNVPGATPGGGVTVPVDGGETVFSGLSGIQQSDAPPLGPLSITPSQSSAPPPVGTAPRNDDGYGGAAESGLPASAGVAPGARGRGNERQRDPGANLATNRGRTTFGRPGLPKQRRLTAPPWQTIKDRTKQNFTLINEGLLGNIIGKIAVKGIGIPVAAALSKDVGLITPLQALKSLFGSGMSPRGSWGGLGVVGTLGSAALGWAAKTALVAAALEAGIGIGSALSAAAETGYDAAGSWFDDLVDEGIEAMFSPH